MRVQCEKEMVLTVASVVLLRAGELNVNCVLVVIVPLLVTVSAVLASYARVVSEI